MGSTAYGLPLNWPSQNSESITVFLCLGHPRDTAMFGCFMARSGSSPARAWGTPKCSGSLCARQNLSQVEPDASLGSQGYSGSPCARKNSSTIGARGPCWVSVARPLSESHPRLVEPMPRSCLRHLGLGSLESPASPRPLKSKNLGHPRVLLGL